MERVKNRQYLDPSFDLCRGKPEHTGGLILCLWDKNKLFNLLNTGNWEGFAIFSSF